MQKACQLLHEAAQLTITPDICFKEALNKSVAALSGSFAAILPFGKLEIHKVFLRFPNVALQQKLSLTALADLFRAS